ncbi:PepSY domain-containing protein [Bordetella sp. LUAb4]|uniref:PepSY-associated TM helix domain-containing protein n=1 Tax=Bordetella sp. LUAb4 TaxID=2843195 RepID=UPI001E62E8FB|nr:PepSY-associated TM helix domain-containing protein [Bordetella sp. LUAb4]
MRPDGKAEGLRQSMSWLHTYTGLLLGWALFAMFLTGTLSYVRDEITAWMKPPVQHSFADAHTAERAVAALRKLAPDAEQWNIDLPTVRQPAVEASWRAKGAAQGRRGRESVMLDAGTGDVLKVPETRGADFFYRFHFEFYGMSVYTGRIIAGIAAFFMLVAIISGVITHKKIFTEFFTFRPRKGQRSWLDAHNALAVLGLPFHFVLTFTGLLLLMFMLLPWGLDAAYDGQRMQFYQERRVQFEPALERPADAAAAVAGVLALDQILRDANQQFGGRGIDSFVVKHPGQADSTVALRPVASDHITDYPVRQLFYTADGLPLQAPPDTATAWSTDVYRAMINVHIGRFAGPALRWVFFLSGIAGTLMVATGLVLWVVKRLPERRKAGATPFSHRLVEVLNVGAIGGLTVAIGSYFWINHLLPAALKDRALWEIRGFFCVWLLCVLHPLLRTHRRAWMEQLSLAAVLLFLLPVLNAVTGGLPLWRSLTQGQWSIAGFELSAMAVAVLLAFAVRKLRAGAGAGAGKGAARRTAQRAATNAPAIAGAQRQASPAPTAAIHARGVESREMGVQQ